MIQNPVDVHFGSYPRGVVLYGLADYQAAEQVAIESAFTHAKKNALATARILNKQLGPVQKITSLETLRMKMERDGRLNRNLIVLPTSYLSVSRDEVEVSVNVSITFGLSDNLS